MDEAHLKSTVNWVRRRVQNSLRPALPLLGERAGVRGTDRREQKATVPVRRACDGAEGLRVIDVVSLIGHDFKLLL
jgi:hypothetical protein